MEGDKMNSHDSYRHIPPDEISSTHDYLRDSDGNFYDVSDDYYRAMIERLKESPKAEIRRRAARRLIETELKELTDKQKQVVIHAMNGMTLRQIAKEMGIHFTTVKEHLTSARRKLKTIIQATEGVITDGDIDIS